LEIKIDTKKDSADDIKKAIDLLQRIVEASGGGSYAPSKINTGSDVATGMMGLFGDNPVVEKPDEDSDNPDDEKEEDIQLIPY